MATQKNVLKKYNLPDKVVFCKKCTISNQRPRITFDKNGICSACNFAKFKQSEINWKERKEELNKLCDLHRKKDGSHDVIVLAAVVKMVVLLLKTQTRLRNESIMCYMGSS